MLWMKLRSEEQRVEVLMKNRSLGEKKINNRGYDVEGEESEMEVKGNNKEGKGKKGKSMD